VSFEQRQMRLRALDELELRVKQFRPFEAIWPFRVPHEPLDLQELIDSALGVQRALMPVELRSRSVIEMEWNEGERWSGWTIALASGVHVYCDDHDEGARVLASVKRGNPIEADRFFLELLAESRGEFFGIEMGGAAPGRIRTPIDDRAFLCDVFVDLLEGTSAEPEVRALVVNASPEDFRGAVERWLEQVLIAPAPSRGRRLRRFRDLEE
jgi:hypothetical protein